MMNYNSLVAYTKTFANWSNQRLADPKRGLPALTSASTHSIPSTLSWNVEEWMVASYKLQWAQLAMEWLEKAALEVLEAYGDEAHNAAFSDIFTTEISEAFDAQAKLIIQNLTTHALSDIMQGVESSSNAMTILDSRAKVDAARAAMEALCGLSRHQMTSSEAVEDIFAGIASREVKREEERAAKVTKVKLFKKERCDGGGYMAVAINHKAAVLYSKHFPGVTQKGAAKECAHDWAFELARDVNGNVRSTINVETV